MKPLPNASAQSGFTLVETLIASFIAAIILGGIIAGGVSLQKAYSASDGSLKASADQMRVMDYVQRDLRQALTVTVSNGGQMLTLTVPDYLDSSTGQPRIPAITPSTSSNGTPNGTVDYGTPSTPVTVAYFPANAPTAPSTTYTLSAYGPYIIRQVGNTQTVISRDSTSLQLNFTDQVSSVKISISYAPRYSLSSQSNTRASTTVSCTTTLRNVRRN